MSGISSAQPIGPELSGMPAQRPANFAIGGEYGRILQLMQIAVLVTAPIWVYLLLFSTEQKAGLGIVLVPMVVLLHMAFLPSVARDDPDLRRVIRLAYIVKIAAAGLFIYTLFHLIGGGDMESYYELGVWFLDNSDAQVIWYPFWGNNFIVIIAGTLFSVTGPSLALAAVVFSSIAFWGEFLFYRALTTGVEPKNRMLAALIVFFLPSIVFWTAALGKDAIITFFIGLTAYGFALVTKTQSRGYLYTALGLGGTCMVRPHIAAMLVIAIVVPFLFSANQKGVRSLLAKILVLPLLLAGLVYLVQQASEFVHADTLGAGLRALNSEAVGTAYGGSAFAAGSSMAERLAMSPFLMLRPFPWEAHSVQAAVAALESAGLLLLLWVRRRNFKHAVLLVRSNGFLLFICCYSVVFHLIFAAGIANLGLLSRQRTMLLPLFLMLICQEVPLTSVPALRTRAQAAVMNAAHTFRGAALPKPAEPR